ncbi:S1 family peptidase [Streptomyces sp. CA-142005]|uniref:S1 family peptidase n=1 Tax=Streptomyces sp. CA-142005 TaxID=3240052 RepID=UPI003D8E9907
MLLRSGGAALWVVLVGGLLAGGVTLRAGGPPARPAVRNVVALVNASAPRNDLFTGQFCGGTLVAPDLVLTARHCLSGRRDGSIDAVVGADNLCHTAPVTGQGVHVTRTLAYPDRSVDAALLVLAGSVRVPPARLPTRTSSVPATGTAFGWGRDGYGGVAPCRRSEVPLRFTDPQRCVRAQRDLGIAPRPQWQLCAQPAPGATRNTCAGDSGGPVLATPAATTITGIISWGPSCRVDDVGVYVSVAPLVPWIDHVAHTQPSG